MDRIINSKKNEYHSEIITGFSDTTRLMSSGVSRSYSFDKYSWIADFLFKHSSNVSTNKHTGYVSFFSDQEIFKNEYGNIDSLYSKYTFLSEYERVILSPYTFELSGKQYYKIGQQRSEIDLIEYINASVIQKYNHTNELSSYEFNHGFNRSPGYHTEGYVVSLKNEYYRQFIWSIPGRSLTKIEDNLFSWTSIAGWEADLTATADQILIDHGDSEVDRIINCQVNVENPQFFYFTADHTFVVYYNESQHYQSGKYDPYLQALSIYDTSWSEIYTSSVMFFPEIISGGILEPAKVIADISAVSECRIGVNSMCHANEADDQSRLIFSICRHMTRMAGGYYAIRQYSTTGLELITDGIDVETERQRRYSSVVMTEPYFVTEPICGAKTCHYMFVDKNNVPVNFQSAYDFLENPQMYLKIKASNDIIDEIDRLLSTQEFNTDIINTIKLPLATYGGKLHSDASYLNNFVFGSDSFYKRQDCCLDDLHGLIGSDRTYTVYTMTPIGDLSSKYTDTMKVSGLGYYCETSIESNIVVNKEFLNIYLSNHTPSSPPRFNDSNPVGPDNKTCPLMDYESFSSNINIDKYEKFRPMIKLPGINGYIKILSKNKNIPVTRNEDGKFEIVYNVEFPYAPGSYSERSLMQFDSYKPTFILYKKSYIPAGDEASYEVGGDSRYELLDLRHKFSGTDVFTWHRLLISTTNNDAFYTSFEKDGGKIVVGSESYKNLVEYPRASVFKEIINEVELLTMYQPEQDGCGHLGTYSILFSDLITEPGSTKSDFDLKLLRFADNRRWKFDDNKFESYINRENPSYVFEIDLDTLFEDFTKYQFEHNSIPDTKRWLYAYLRCMATTIIDVDADNSNQDVQNLNYTIEENVELKNTDSEIIIEVWDNKSLIGTSRGGNWQPAVSKRYDLKKVPGPVIVDGLYVSSFDVVSISNSVLPLKADMYKITLVPYNLNSVPNYLFPDGFYDIHPELVYGASGFTNKVLYNKYTGDSFHIAYVKGIGNTPSPTRDLIDVYIIPLPDSDLSSLVFSATADIAIVGGPLQIRDSVIKIGKTPVDIYSSQSEPSDPAGVITRYFDIRSYEKQPDGSEWVDGDGNVDRSQAVKFDSTPADIARYVDENNKIFFRARVSRSKEYPVSTDSIDQSSLQHAIIIDDDQTYSDESVNPWTGYPSAFDFSKILLNERVKKFGVDYFRCASK